MKTECGQYKYFKELQGSAFFLVLLAKLVSFITFSFFYKKIHIIKSNYKIQVTYILLYYIIILYYMGEVKIWIFLRITQKKKKIAVIYT